MFKSRKSNSQVSPLAPPVLANQSTLSNGSISGPGRRSPAYAAGNPMDRVGSYHSDSLRSDKSEKRRSGFFGLGKKDKDKEIANGVGVGR